MPQSDRWTMADYQAYLVRLQPPRIAQAPTSSLSASQEPDEREDAFRGRVRRLALDNGFMWYHTCDSRRSDEGFPDCTMAKPGRLIFAELKDRTRKPTHEQEVWLDLLRHSVPGVEAYLWRPQDWGEIYAILTRR